MYEIIFDPNTIDFLEKLPKEIRLRIFNKILSTKSNPFRYFERLKSRKDYKLRVGDYRICADIDNQTIVITLIGHRKNIYKK
ncbi:type II toxin-antitoxin system RelE/ParE family toxin [Candidatus Woesearchaeota archaeon]|nr:type II toxin-antitoxin system RelE/ParE family toxin [Candidatus Woesearchaeota archaeon]